MFFIITVLMAAAHLAGLFLYRGRPVLGRAASMYKNSAQRVSVAVLRRSQARSFSFRRGESV